ncbi:MAG: hypothetical protein GC134_04180 [Proteobacteria bacterium]|nr:hypothetical protein [Pseudomonadota bacterium]
MKRLLYGICGIGLGHMYRQLPILEALRPSHKIAIFAYGESLTYCRAHFAGDDNIQVIPVAVPYLVGNDDGLDFTASAAHLANRQDFFTINAQAFATAEAFIGTPDMVITDYEPTSAQYAYAHDAPLYTIDQQSKYLVGDFPGRLNGFSNADEIARLRMFFPVAAKRIVFSFFDVPVREEYRESTLVLPPLLRPSLAQATWAPDADKYVIYLSAQDGFCQSVADVIAVCQQFGDKTFHLYAKGVQAGQQGNVMLHPHNDGTFDAHLLTCEGLICTAGHSLLSEAVSLGIPIYAMPLDLYEQQMNAHMVQKNGWGVAHATFHTSFFTNFQATLLHAYQPNGPQSPANKNRHQKLAIRLQSPGHRTINSFGVKCWQKSVTPSCLRSKQPRHQPTDWRLCFLWV